MSFEARVLFVVLLVAVVCALVILDVVFSQPARPAFVAGRVVSGVQVPAERGNTIIIRGVNVGESIGKDAPALTEAHLDCLRTEVIQTNEGRTRVRKFLRLKDPNVGGFSGGTLVFGETEAEKVGVFLHFPAGQDMFEYEMEFDPGLDSKIEDGELDDLRLERVHVLGRDCEFVDSRVDTDNNRVRLRLFCGDNRIDFTDNDYTDNNFQVGGVEVNGERLVDSRVLIRGFERGRDAFRIVSIKFRARPWPKIGSDVYVGVRQGALQKQRQRGAFLSSNFDILFGGFAGARPKVSVPRPAGVANVIRFDARGDDEYRLEFVNKQGRFYSFTLAHTRGGLHYGDEDNNFVFTGGTSIRVNDYFAVTNTQDVRGVTNIIELSQIGSGEVTFVDLAGGSKTVPFDTSTGDGTAVFGGNQYKFNVNTATNTITVDVDGDGTIAGGEAQLVTAGGTRINLNAGLTFEHVVPRRLFVDEPPSTDEKVKGKIFVEDDDINIDITSGVTLIKNDATGWEEGLTGFGTFVRLDDRRSTARDLVFENPVGGRRTARVGVGGGQAEGYVLVTCERDEFVKKAMEARRRS